jgi:hypothetical protein
MPGAGDQFLGYDGCLCHIAITPGITRSALGLPFEQYNEEIMQSPVQNVHVQLATLDTVCKASG